MLQIHLIKLKKKWDQKHIETHNLLSSNLRKYLNFKFNYFVKFERTAQMGKYFWLLKMKD